MQLRTQASTKITRSAEDVFDVAVDPARVSEYMTKKGPIPGVVAVEMMDGATPGPGARRQVTMSDRSLVGEEIVALERPSRHGYRWLAPPAFPFSLIVRGAEADWAFVPEGGATRVTWSYRFELTTPLVYPLALAAVALFRSWMRNALERLRVLLDRS